MILVKNFASSILKISRIQKKKEQVSYLKTETNSCCDLKKKILVVNDKANTNITIEHFINIKKSIIHISGALYRSFCMNGIDGYHEKISLSHFRARFVPGIFTLRTSSLTMYI